MLSRFLSAMALVAIVPVAVADQGASPSPTSLYLRAGTIDTAPPAPPLAESLAAIPPEGRIVIQLDGPITPQRRARLAGAGLMLGDYLPSYAYISRVGKADARALAGLEFVRWWSPFKTEWKLDPDIGKRVYSTPERLAITAKGRDQLTVSCFSGADAEAVKKSIWKVKAAQVLNEDAIAGHIEFLVEVPLAAAPALASIPGVQFVEPAPEVTLRSNYTTRWIVQSNVLNNFPLYANGLRGEGQIVGELDGRVDVNHCSFSDTQPIGPTHRKIVGMQTTGAGSSHGTHVAGTVVGNNPAGLDTDNTRGVAYMGKLSWGTYGAVNAADFNTGVNFNRSNGATIHTNSWGNDGTTTYDALCRAVDEQSYNNEGDMICFAVTNQSLLKNPENAKNVLAVGNSGDTPNQTTVCTGGAGPTSDGRRKPEIWAPGCSTQSSSSGTTCGTVSSTGTSMACPAIAGTAMLVRQYFTDGYYPSGAAGTAPGFNPSGALLRAVLMNTGQDMAPAGYPSAAEGWGRVKADDALFFPGDTRRLKVRDIRNSDAEALDTLDETVIDVQVLGAGQPLRITVSWTEPPAAAGASSAATNDLDLVVEAPGGGATYLGNAFSGGQSTTGGSKDAINNTEQVLINTPSVGTYTVRIKGANVAVGRQGFAMVANGDIVGGTPPALAIFPSGTPAMVPPGQPFSVNVEVIPGGQAVVPGSPTAWYRYGGGAFTSFPLISTGGTGYRADFPAPLCADDPEYYFSAQGDGGATVQSPANAPTGFYSTTVGVIGSSTIFTESFESGLPSGWTTSGLWNIGSACTPGGACDGPTWAYYGQPASCTFNTGATTSGNLVSAPIALPALPPGGSITLTYCSAKITENNASYDKGTVLVNGTTVIDTTGDSASFETRNASLTAFAGQTVTLTWRFDSVDSVSNNFRGWHVDNARITVVGTTCTDPPSCYANCDQSTVAPVLNVADFTCFLGSFANNEPYANCDLSTAPPTLNVADFTCFLQKYAAGCP